MKLSLILSPILLLAAGCLSASAAAGDTGNPIADAIRPRGARVDRAWKRYRNSDLGYCVSYPSRWLKEDAFDGTGLSVKTGLQRYSQPSGEIDIGPVSASTLEDARLKPASTLPETFDADLDDYLSGLRKFVRAEKMQVLEQQLLTLQGQSALYVKHQYYDPLERSVWMGEVVFIKRKGELYRLQLQCPPSQIMRFEPVFAYLVNTFEFDCAK
jgi:hypothetical protein